MADRPREKSQGRAKTSAAPRAKTTTKAAAKKPAAAAKPKPAPKRKPAKKRAKKRAPKLPRASDAPHTGTFMPGKEDPLDSPPLAVEAGAVALVRIAEASELIAEPSMRAVHPFLAMPSVMEAPSILALSEDDQEDRILKRFKLATNEGNDFARLGVILGVAMAITFGVSLAYPDAGLWVSPGWVSLVGALGAALLGVRGYNASATGLASNPKLSVAAISIGTVVVLAQLVTEIVRAFGA